ncbi:MAG TPA: sulfite exporter TauE/SafE family protein, partial [Coleofasciculaceae cyanobacterium]
MLDLLLIASLGFLGSFGHCAGMCGPITAAFSLSQAASQAAAERPKQAIAWQQISFHLLLNVGRILSYALVGIGIGAIGSVLIAGGQMAGVGSGLRRGMAILTGLLLIGFGLAQISPGLLPRLPFLHPLAPDKLHQRLGSGMVKLSLQQRWWTPLLLGVLWGLIPCGFLYTAQLKAAETLNFWHGGATMLAFGLGTLPMMLGVGVFTSRVSADRRSQMFRMGGWITLFIGILTLFRTGDTMVDYTGHAALICLLLALAARPISRFWAAPLRYRRALGIGAFGLSIA